METRGWKWWNVNVICFEHFEHLPSFTTDILFERLAKHSGHQFSQLKAKQDQRAVTTVAIKKGGGGHKLDKKKAQLEKNCKILRMFLRILRTRCRRVPRWRQWIEGHEFQRCEKWRKHVLLLKFWSLFLTYTYSSQVSSMVDQDEGRPESREEGGSFFALRKR